jgi:hypothetical protein
MRKIIAALQVSLDGFVEGPNEELDWVDSWEDPFDVVDKVDAFIIMERNAGKARCDRERRFR